MSTAITQEQYAEINQKMDLILDFVEEQRRKQETIEDLFKDLNIVAKDAFHHSVELLDKAQVELDTCSISCLLIKVLQNLNTFHEMLDMLESARDFLKDATPILHQVGLDAVNKMHELEQKGYFESVGGIVSNLTDPDLLAAMNRTTRVLKEVRMDDRLDDKSLFQIFRQLRSPEVRKSLSYSLRLLQELNKANNQ
jgi:uncharacterized protein YjgD (DUF1641 family)